MSLPRRALLALRALAALPRGAAAEEPALDALLSRCVTLPADGAARVHYARWKASAPDMAALDGWIAAAAARRSAARPRAAAGTDGAA